MQAGQVYGVPLSGTLLTKSGIFPEQRSCGEDFRKKWIEVYLFNPFKFLNLLHELTNSSSFYIINYFQVLGHAFS